MILAAVTTITVLTHAGSTMWYDKTKNGFANFLCITSFFGMAACMGVWGFEILQLFVGRI